MQRVNRSSVWRVLGMVLALWMLAPGVAMAEDSGDAAAGSLLLTTTTTSSLIVPVGVTIGVVLTVQSSSKRSMNLQRYLNENRAQVHASLTTGGGASARDLAALLGVPTVEQARFSMILRRERHALRALLGDAPVTGERAAYFAAHLAAAMSANVNVNKTMNKNTAPTLPVRG